MKIKKYWEMTVTQLAAATKKFDEPFIGETSRPLTPAERSLWRKATRKRGRPRLGEGYQRISVSLEKNLLKQATALAKRRGIPRSQLISQALAAELAKPAN